MKFNDEIRQNELQGKTSFSYVLSNTIKFMNKSVWLEFIIAMIVVSALTVLSQYGVSKVDIFRGVTFSGIIKSESVRIILTYISTFAALYFTTDIIVKYFRYGRQNNFLNDYGGTMNALLKNLVAALLIGILVFLVATVFSALSDFSPVFLVIAYVFMLFVFSVFAMIESAICYKPDRSFGASVQKGWDIVMRHKKIMLYIVILGVILGLIKVLLSELIISTAFKDIMVEVETDKLILAHEPVVGKTLEFFAVFLLNVIQYGFMLFAALFSSTLYIAYDDENDLEYYKEEIEEKKGKLDVKNF